MVVDGRDGIFWIPLWSRLAHVWGLCQGLFPERDDREGFWSDDHLLRGGRHVQSAIDRLSGRCYRNLPVVFWVGGPRFFAGLLAHRIFEDTGGISEGIRIERRLFIMIGL